MSQPTSLTPALAVDALGLHVRRDARDARAAGDGWAPSPQQLAFFTTFGYLVLPQLMRDRIAEITDEFVRVFTAAGVVHDGSAHSVLVPFLDRSASLCSLLDDPRVHAINRAIFGDRYNYLNSAGNYYVGDSPWHSDVPLRPAWPDSLRSINISFYLDPTTRSTGALRVIPGSHHPGERFADALVETLEDARHGERLGLRASDIPAQALETEPGDVLVFNNYLKQASFGGGSSRRMLVLNFSRSYPGACRDGLRGLGYGGALLSRAGARRMAQLYEVLDAKESCGQPLSMDEQTRWSFIAERTRRAMSLRAQDQPQVG